jgi:hypothetical protein
MRGWLAVVLPTIVAVPGVALGQPSPARSRGAADSGSTALPAVVPLIAGRAVRVAAGWVQAARPMHAANRT